MDTSVLENKNWMKNQLLEGLDITQIQLLAPFMKKELFKAGEQIIQAGEDGDRMFLIESGKVRVYKDDVTLTFQEQGTYFGAMALLDQSKRSANVEAIESTILQSITIDTLKDLSPQTENSIYSTILINHLSNQQSNVRRLSEATVTETKAKLAEAEKQIEFGKFFMTIFLIMVIYIFVLGAFLQWNFLAEGVYLSLISPIFIIGTAFISWKYMIDSGYGLGHFGLSIQNWQIHAKQSLYYSLGFIVFITGVKWIMVYFFDAFDGSLFATPDFPSDHWSVIILIYVGYTLLSPFQELLIRGVMQGGIAHFLKGKRNTIKSIILSNILFSSLHVGASMDFALVTLLPGFFWGWMYAKQRTIVGVSISHALVGLYGSLILGFF